MGDTQQNPATPSALYHDLYSEIVKHCDLPTLLMLRQVNQEFRLLADQTFVTRPLVHKTQKTETISTTILKLSDFLKQCRVRKRHLLQKQKQRAHRLNDFTLTAKIVYQLRRL
jgi:hypothetical protein